MTKKRSKEEEENSCYSKSMRMTDYWKETQLYQMP